MNNKHESVGYYLDPYRWIGEAPILNDNYSLDGTRIRDLVYEQQIVSQHCELKIYAYRDGLFQFDFHAINFDGVKTNAPIVFGGKIDLQRPAIKIMNTHILFMFLANMGLNSPTKLRLKTISIRPSDLWFEDNSVYGIVSRSSGINVPPEAFMARSRVENKVYSINTALQSDTQLALFLTRTSVAVPTIVLEKATEWLTNLLTHQDFNRLIILWDLYTKALQLSFNFDTDLSLATSWVIIETILSDWLDRLITSNKLIKITQTKKTVTFQNQYSERKQFNTDNFGFLSSYNCIELLNWADELPRPQAEVLHEVRKIRNEWIHSLKPTTEVHLDNARMAIFDMVQHIYQFRFD